MFIRDQASEWCNSDFCDAAHEARPKVFKGRIDLMLDWFAIWRGV